MKQNEYIIQNQVYTQEQIEKLSLAEWAVNWEKLFIGGIRE